MANSKNSFFIKKKKGIIFSITVILFLVLLINSGDVYYNKFVNFLSNKTNEIIVLPKMKEKAFHLGLDLQGGVQLVYRADVSQIPDADKDDLLEGVKNVIEQRINAFGVSEPVIQVNKSIDGDYRVIVELAGVKSVDEAIKEIGETPRLEFKEQDLNSENISAENLDLMAEYNNGLKDKAQELLEQVKGGTDFVQLAVTNNTPKDISSDKMVGAENDGDLGWISAENNKDIFEIVKNMNPGQTTDIIEKSSGYSILKMEEKKAKDGSLLITDVSKTEYKVREIFLQKMTANDLMAISENWKNTELTGKNLKKAVLTFNQNDNSPQVSLEFDDEGAELFKEITARNISRPVAIYLDDYPISVPTVNEQISDGKAVISGSFNIAEAKELVQRLKAGALPVPIELINQKTVGASLGNKSITDSLTAGLFGLLLVALFMILIYRIPGLLSVFSLMLYGLMVLTVFKALPIFVAIAVPLFFLVLMLMTFEELHILDIALTMLFVVVAVILLIFGINSITLTLAGIAGFILSIGMAVDANVLIFERFKEELRAGRSAKDAVDESIRKSWPSIRDGNISTLLICLILMGFGTGVLKGFGTTLFIGVSVSMFSAIVVTRNLLSLFVGKRLEKRMFLLGVNKKNIQKS